MKTRTAEITYEKDHDYILIKILPDVTIDEEDALDNMLVVKNLCNGNKTLKLLDLRGKWKITSAAKKVSQKNIASETTLAAAYLIDSFVTKLTLKFLQSFYKKDVPQKFFTETETALQWLKSHSSK